MPLNTRITDRFALEELTRMRRNLRRRDDIYSLRESYQWGKGPASTFRSACACVTTNRMVVEVNPGIGALSIGVDEQGFAYVGLYDHEAELAWPIEAGNPTCDPLNNKPLSLSDDQRVMFSHVLELISAKLVVRHMRQFSRKRS